jgi:hypothetical protein
MRPLNSHSFCTKYRYGTVRAPKKAEYGWEEVMLKLSVENIGDLAVVQCEGRIVQSEAAFKLREAVTLQGDARVVVLDLSEVRAV